MNKLVPLMYREWLQHRFGWLLMVAVPLALGLLLTGFGTVQIDDTRAQAAGAALPALMAVGAIAATIGVIFMVVWFGAMIIVSGLARRDHADRSIEFWLSLPAGHAESFLSPMLVHLILAPAVALGVGLVGGYAMSLVLVGRAAGIGGWLALPWLDILPASLAIVGRLLVGLPLATLWLLPIILAVVLLSAWFRKWSWVVFGVGIGLGSLLLKNVFGQPFLSEVMHDLILHAMHALVNSFAGGSVRAHDPESALVAVQSLPAWALVDAGRALRDLASPLMLGGLVFSGVCFALLVQWRERNAGAAE